MPEEQPVKHFSAFDVILIVACVVFIGVFIVKMAPPREKSQRPKIILEVGQLLPMVEAQGWVNGDKPTPETLAGKVVVIDAWATWCLPCRQEAPHLIEIYQKYKDRGVIFIGLTSEGEDSVSYIQEYLDETGITWLNGWGAIKTLIALKAEYIPTAWVVGPDGRIVWNSESEGSLEDGIEQALALGSAKAGQ